MVESLMILGAAMLCLAVVGGLAFYSLSSERKMSPSQTREEWLGLAVLGFPLVLIAGTLIVLAVVRGASFVLN